MSKVSGNELMQLAMQIEENGHAFYQQAQKTTDDPRMQDIFRYLAQEERQHYQLFADIAADLGISTDRYEEAGMLYLDALVSLRLFDSPGASIRKAVQARDAKDLLRFALLFEKDTILFFYELLDRVDESKRAAIRELIAEEKRHVKQLTDLLQQL